MYRRKAILAELKHYSADIICLQEVVRLHLCISHSSNECEYANILMPNVFLQETDQFFNYFLPELQADGYSVRSLSLHSNVWSRNDYFMAFVLLGYICSQVPCEDNVGV